MARAPRSLVRYADDLVACCHSREQAEQVKARLAEWLAPRGLVFNEDKTTHRAPRQRGSTSSGSTSAATTEAGKLLIKPSRRRSSGSGSRLADEMRALRGSNAGAVIARLNPIIRGWAAYYRGVVSSKVFGALDDYMWQLTYRWASHSHPNKPKKWIARPLLRQVQQVQERSVGVRRPALAATTAATSPTWSSSPGLPSSGTSWSRAGRLPTTPT